MRSKTDTIQRRPFGQALARALPFESAWIRYAVCLCLAACLSAAAWAWLAIQPATRAELARAGYLLDLEQEFEASQHLGSDLPSLREQARSARSQLFSDKQSVDLAIVALVDQIKARGWAAVVTSAEFDDQSSSQLARAAYQLELNQAAPSNVQVPGEATITKDALSFLEFARSAPEALDIERFEIIAEPTRPAKVFITLAAHIAK